MIPVDGSTADVSVPEIMLDAFVPAALVCMVYALIWGYNSSVESEFTNMEVDDGCVMAIV